MVNQDPEIDLRHIRYVVTLARELNFGRAAKELSITQQTLSAQIAQLERRLSLELFIRDRRHVELTEAGKVLVDWGQRLLVNAQDLMTALGLAKPPLRLDVISDGNVPDVLVGRLRARVPDLDMEILHGNGFAATVNALNKGNVDLTFGRIRRTGARLSETLSCELVRLAPMGVALPPGHALVARDEISLTELADYPLLTYVAPEALEWQDWHEQLVVEFGL